MKFLGTILLLCVLATAGMAQSVSSKKQELKRLRSSIQATQKKLERLKNEEASTKRNLSSYQRRQHSVAVFVRTLEEELARLRDSAQVVKRNIQRTKSALYDAEKSYEKTARSLLKYKASKKGNYQSAVTTDAVFRSLTKRLANYRSNMLRLRDSLQAAESLLEDYSATRESALHVKETEERTLRSTIAKSSQELKKLRRDKSTVTKQLQAKQRSAQKLNSIINKLVAEARRKAEERARQPNKGSSAPAPSGSVKGFARKSLPWPTASTKLLNGYGTYKNPQTGTVLDNPGIDIRASKGSTVKSVASGEVSSVTFLPGYNSIVIVDHGNGVRTVYGNLASVSVSVGSKVSAGSAVGTSGENIDGELLHFEIWNGKQRQNPSTYLR